MLRLRPKFYRTIESTHISLVASFAGITIWISLVVASGGLLGCVVILVLWTVDATTGWQFRIAPKLSTAALSDRLAWLAFSFGVWAMLGITLMALLSEGDGDFRTWDEIRRGARMFLAAGLVAVVVPMFVAVWQFGTRQGWFRRVGIVKDLPELV